MDDVVRIGDREYPLVTDRLQLGGKRAVTRTQRPTNGTDPGRIKRVEWRLDGPVGGSQESVVGYLGVDYTQNIETRFPRRILSLGKRTAVSLSASNPPVVAAGTSSMYGSAYYGTSYYGGVQAVTGTSSSSGDVVRFMAELQGYLFVFHGAIVNQIDMSTWTVVDTEVLPALVVGVAVWQNWLWIAYGASNRMSIIISASSSGMNIQHNYGLDTLLVTALAPGSDRLWFGIFDGTNPDQPTNNISYTFDYFNTYASPFPIGNPVENINGIGSHGPYTYAGKISNLFSFTDQGKPVPLSRALVGHKSAHNGARYADPGWGWLYCTADIGQRAIAGHTDNPVGIGERMKQFTGHSGRTTEVFADRGEKWDAVLTVAGHSYMYRCVFSSETGGSGQPDLYPSRYITDAEVGCIFASNTPTNPVIIWGEDGNIAYETISRDGRDDLFAARLYSTSGGIWYGTTLDRDPNLLKTLRLARCRVLNVEYCSDWQLAVTFDVNPWVTDPDYIDIGPLMDIPGQHTLIGNAGPDGQPLHNISGRNFKPRLTQRADGTNAETLPPEVNGALEIEYDERPAMIEEVTLLLQGGDDIDTRMAELTRLASEQSDGPFKVLLPGDKPLDSKYAMVAGQPQRKDLKGNGVEGIEVTLQVWLLD